MYANIPFLRKSLHLIPIIPVYFIIITVTFSFTKYYLLDFFKISAQAEQADPSLTQESGSIISFSLLSLIKGLLIISFYFSAVMVLICHLLSMFSSPGENPIWEKSLESIKNIKDDLYCNKCLLARPERAHHCKICQKCILKMDHHCPWVANCVGLQNQKYFFLFLFYATLGDFIAFCCLISKFIYIDIDAKINENLASGARNSNNNTNKTAIDLVMDLKDPLICFLGTILAFFMTVSIGFLFTVQFLNLTKNKTTIELKIFESKDSPYKYSLWRDNFESVMGNKMFLWFFPVYHEDVKYNFKKEKKQNNYMSLCDIEDNNLELNVPEI